jgi:hypothetical protein
MDSFCGLLFERIPAMVRYLASLGLLFGFAFSALAQSNPVVAVLRDSDTSLRGADRHRDSAILLDSQANVINVISGLGVTPSLSSQNTLQFDSVHRRIIVAENLCNRVSVFDYDGTSQLTIQIENVAAIVLTNDAKQIGCVTGTTINDRQTVFFDTTTGKDIRRLNLDAVAVTNDVVGSQLWAIGKHLTAFDPDGDIRIRRPLTQLPAELKHPTVINSRNWCGVGVAVEPNQNDWWRRIWVIERNHPEVTGSKNRLFAVDPDGQTRILVELNEIDPTSIACATYRGDLKRILVVDRVTGNLVSFNSDGELMGKVDLDVQLVGYGEHSGLWVAGRESIRRLDPSDLSVLAEHLFDQECDSVGLAVR